MADQSTGAKLNAREIATFCAQIAMILKSGIPVAEGIGIMCDDLKNASGHEILQSIHSKVDSGGTLFEALEDTGKFPKYMVDMVEIGEKTGKLDDVMDSLCAFYEREQAVKRSIRNAVTYPLVMIVLMLLVIGVLIVQVLPIFAEVFRDLGSEMTGFSRSVMNLGQLISNYAIGIVIALVLIVVALLVLRTTAAWGRVKRNFPLTKSLNTKMASGHFASAMAMMISSGLDTDQSLDMVYKLADNELVKNKIEVCKQHLADGLTFADALVKAQLFTGVYARMVTVGFKTGSVDLVMQKVADQYEEEVDVKMSNMISVLEPTLVAVLSIIVGMILLSVMLPLMGIMSSIGL